MSLHPKDPGISNFVIPQLAEMINILAESDIDSDLLFMGGDLEAATLLDGYRSGLFPMPLEGDQIGWFSPVHRGLFITMERYDGSLPFRITRSLKKSLSKFTFTLNTSFEDVLDNCANPERPGSWITPQIHDAYVNLNRLGWAHSFEVWTIDNGVRVLAGGLYGVAIGGLFAGESMFHHKTDGSKAALLVLVATMVGHGGLIIDTQWQTEHLASMGAISIPRSDYLELLDEALSRPLPYPFATGFAGDISLTLDSGPYVAFN